MNTDGTYGKLDIINICIDAEDNTLISKMNNNNNKFKIPLDKLKEEFVCMPIYLLMG